MSEIIYRVRDLVKDYGANRAVDGVSFDVEAGRCLGLLGPNGAGKSTTIEIMEGISAATSGTVHFRDRPLDDDFRQAVGVMFQSTALPEFITVEEVLRMFSRLYRSHGDVAAIIERCGVGEFAGQATQKLSGGQRQRLLLAVALINDPEIIFLDEPTTGLDPGARQRLWTIIEECKAAGKTIILTTHYMEEAYALCDSIILMHQGRIVAQGSPRQLLAEQFNTQALALPAPDEAVVEALRGRLGGDESMSVNVHGGELVLECADVNAALRLLIDAELDLSEMHIRKSTLEDLFFKLTGN